MSLARAAFIPIPPGSRPGFDHADVYGAGRRLYLAHPGADRIDVLDCAANTFLRSVPDLPRVAGVLIDEEHDLLFSSDRGCASVSVFRCSDERLLGRAAVGPHLTVQTEQGAHTSGWDPIGRALYVFCPRSDSAAVYEERA